MRLSTQTAKKVLKIMVVIYCVGFYAVVVAHANTAQVITPCVTTQIEHNRYSRFIWGKYGAPNGNFFARRPTKRQITKLDNLRKCATSLKAKHNMRRYMRAQVKQWRWYHYMDTVVTPFGKWAVPAAVVRCEGGYNGWTTYNHGGSGAAGPYQLLGHGAPMPAVSVQAKATHHIIAHNLYLSSGLGPWISSRSCWG